MVWVILIGLGLCLSIAGTSWASAALLRRFHAPGPSADRSPRDVLLGQLSTHLQHCSKELLTQAPAFPAPNPLEFMRPASAVALVYGAVRFACLRHELADPELLKGLRAIAADGIDQLERLSISGPSKADVYSKTRRTLIFVLMKNIDRIVDEILARERDPNQEPVNSIEVLVGVGQGMMDPGSEADQGQLARAIDAALREAAERVRESAILLNRAEKQPRRERSPAPGCEPSLPIGLQEEDMQSLVTIAAFAWKHAGMTPAQAVEYAMVTIHLTRHGSPREKADAEVTWQSAVKWSLHVGLDAMRWGMECVVLAQEQGTRS